MAFNALSEYSEGVFPECGYATAYTICPGVSGYNPIDVSGLQGAIDGAIDSAISSTQQNIDNISGKVDILADEWGTKFISIDKHDLNIVNPENYASNYVSVNNNLEEQKARCNEIVNTIVSKTEKVKSYLQQLESNNQKYEETIDKYNDCQQQRSDLSTELANEQSKEEPNQGVIYSLQTSIATLDAVIRDLDLEIKKYESSKIDSPDGSWVLG